MWPYHLKVCTKDYIALNFNKTQLNNNKIKVFLTTAYQKKTLLGPKFEGYTNQAYCGYSVVDKVLWIYYVYLS